jgi:hypothetical protein
MEVLPEKIIPAGKQPKAGMYFFFSDFGEN